MTNNMSYTSASDVTRCKDENTAEAAPRASCSVVSMQLIDVAAAACCHRCIVHCKCMQTCDCMLCTYVNRVGPSASQWSDNSDRDADMKECNACVAQRMQCVFGPTYAMCEWKHDANPALSAPKQQTSILVHHSDTPDPSHSMSSHDTMKAATSTGGSDAYTVHAQQGSAQYIVSTERMSKNTPLLVQMRRTMQIAILDCTSACTLVLVAQHVLVRLAAVGSQVLDSCLLVPMQLLLDLCRNAWWPAWQLALSFGLLACVP